MVESGSPFANLVEHRWDPARVEQLDALGRLAYRSNLLGADRAVANFGGGNTSTKAIERDHLGREIEVLWVKGSGSDLATIGATGFTGLRLAELLPLAEREAMTDAAMVAHLARCQLEPGMPRSSIETLLHAFVPFRCVDHTHPDAINMICCAVDGERLARECFGDDAVWIPYIRPGFALSRLVADALGQHPNAKLLLLAKHGLVTWGDDDESCYRSTLDAINRAATFVNERAAGLAPFGGAAAGPTDPEDREALLATVLPILRGDASTDVPKIAIVDTSPGVLEFVRGAESRAVSQIGAACPDHLVHTKTRPLWIDFDSATESASDLIAKLQPALAAYRDAYAAYYEREMRDHVAPDGGELGDPAMADPNPRVVLIAGIGLIGVGRDAKAATLSRDLYHRAIAVMRGASAVSEFVSLSDAESFAVEYWPLELYKLTLAPPPKELAGRIALITGGAGGIGSAIARTLSAQGACLVLADLDEGGAQTVANELGTPAIGVAMDATDEVAVARAFRQAVLTFGGVDIVVANAGLASSAAIEETSLDEWNRNHDVLTKGYFLTAREAFRVLKPQGIGGSLIFVASKNALVAGKNAAAYSSAKAAELHLARCLAEEGGAAGIRANTVNPDAVLRGSKIWGSQWREERAAAYGIDPDELEAHYRARTTLKVNIYPEDIAEAVLFFASPRRSGKSTGNLINVDGGIAAAYPR